MLRTSIANCLSILSVLFPLPGRRRATAKKKCQGMGLLNIDCILRTKTKDVCKTHFNVINQRRSATRRSKNNRPAHAPARIVKSDLLRAAVAADATTQTIWIWVGIESHQGLLVLTVVARIVGCLFPANATSVWLLTTDTYDRCCVLLCYK